MRTPRVIILSVLDGRGRFGLGPCTAMATACGAEVIPVETGVVDAEAPGDRVVVRPLRPRLVASALRAALAEPADGMLIGLLPGYWQARAVAGVLRQRLPDTLVYAPLSDGFDALPLLGGHNRRLQLSTLLPEATVTVLPGAHAGALLGRDRLDAAAAAAAVVDAGSHAAWLRGTRADGRGIDLLRVGTRVSLLDYPPVPAGAMTHAAPAALAALLATGRPLGESVEQANRTAARLGNIAHVAAAG